MLNLIRKICAGEGIKIQPMDDRFHRMMSILEKEDEETVLTGYTTREPDGSLHIDLDTSLPEADQAFTLLHELGHCVLGHMGMRQADVGQLEREADSFAMIMTALMLWDKYREVPHEK